MIPHAMAEIGDPRPWIVFAAIVIAILGILGVGLMLTFARKLRADIADELKREMVSQSQAQPVAVQQPLHVKAAEEFATREEHRELAAKLDEELGRERSSRKKMHEEVAALQGDVKALSRENQLQSEALRELKADGKNASTKVDTLIGEMKQINQQTQQIALALQRRVNV